MYLTGTTHWIGTEAAAMEHVAKQTGMCVVRQETDKTYSIFYLSETPREPRQVEFQLRDGEIVFGGNK